MLDELRKIPLFADLSEEDLERLYRMAETVSIPAGQLVLRECDSGDSLFVVLDGELEVTRRHDLPRCVHCKRAACWWSARSPSRRCSRAALPRP